MRTLDLWFHFVTRDLCVITFATRKNKTDVIIYGCFLFIKILHFYRLHVE